MNPTTTLGAIRAQHPCKDGWETLLKGLGYADGNYDTKRVVSLGDIATTNDAEDAYWAIRAFDWSDIAVRRAVIAGALMPTVRRAVEHTKDKRVHDTVDALTRWCAGDDAVDLREAAARAAWAATRAAEAARAAWAAAEAAEAMATLEAERERQRQDIIAAFPPVALAVKK